MKFDDFNNRIKELENAIKKRDELILIMMRNSPAYQHFMLGDNMNIDGLYKAFKVKEYMEKNKNRKIFNKKLDILGNDVFKKN